MSTQIKFNSLASKMLCIPQINALDSAVEKAQVKTFHKSIEKALLLLQGNKWLKDAEGKQYLKDINATQEEVVKEAYGFNKQQYSLYIRVAKATERIPNLVTNFLAKCEAKLGAASYGMQAFDDYIKALDKAVANPLNITEGNEGGAEGNIEDVMAEVDVVKTKPIITLAFNGEAIGQKNVSLRVTDKGEMKTTSSVEDIEAVIAYLKKAVKQLKTDKVDEKPKASTTKAVDKPKASTQPKVDKAVAVADKPKASKYKVMTPEEIKAKALADFEASLEPVEVDDMDVPF